MKLSRNDKVILAQKHDCTVEYIRLIEAGERSKPEILADITFLLQEKSKINTMVMNMRATPKPTREKKTAKRKVYEPNNG